MVGVHCRKISNALWAKYCIEIRKYSRLSANLLSLLERVNDFREKCIFYSRYESDVLERKNDETERDVEVRATFEYRQAISL